MFKSYANIKQQKGDKQNMNFTKYFNLTKKHLFIYFLFVYMGTSIIGEILGLPFIIELIIWFVLMEIGELLYKKIRKYKTDI